MADWRAEVIVRMRRCIEQADPDIVEEVKWRKPSNAMAGVPVWSHDGVVCTGETYKDKVKFTFAKGAALEDPAGLFNAVDRGATRRAIDVREGDKVDEKAFKALVRAAVLLNVGSAAKPKATKAKAPAGKAKAVAGKAASKGAAPKLLSGGNPQIPKGYGEAPVQAYLAAIPGWKQEVARRVDALVVRNVPKVRKAVKWNSPLYGAGPEGAGWFLGIHLFTRYVKLAFFRGAALRPLPPGESKQKEVRYLDIHEGDAIDEKQLATWIRQAAALPGEVM